MLEGGPAGCSLAANLARETDYNIYLFEKRNRLGGLQYSVEIDEISYDVGAFLFNHDHAIFDCFPDLKEIMVEKEGME